MQLVLYHPNHRNRSTNKMLLIHSISSMQTLGQTDCQMDTFIKMVLLLTVLHPFNGLFPRTTWVRRYEKGKTSLHLNDAGDDGVLGWQAINLAPDR